MEENIKNLQARANFLSVIKNNAQNAQNIGKIQHEKVFQDLDILQPIHEDCVRQILPIKELPITENLKYEEVNFEKTNNLHFLMCDEELPLSEDEKANLLDLNIENKLDPFNDSDNSRDVDYVPDINKYSDDSRDVICDSPTEKVVIISNVLLKPKDILSRPTTNNYGKPNSSGKLNINLKKTEHCEYDDCTGETFSSCGYCECYLCWNHFNDDIAYNNCKNHKKCSSQALQNCDVIDTVRQDDKIYDDNTDNSAKDNGQHCEFIGCAKTAYSSCTACFCLLCLDHFAYTELKCDYHKPYTSEPSDHILQPLSTKNGQPQNKKLQANTICKEENYHKLLKPEYIESDGKTLNLNEQHCEFINCVKKAYSTCTACFCLLCLDHFDHSEMKCVDHRPHTTEPNLTASYLTAKGTIRKRKLYEEDLKTRNKKKADKEIEKMTLKSPCNENCKKKCTSTFKDEEREAINNQYNNLDRNSQGIFIKSLVDVKPVNRRKQGAAIKKNTTYIYNFVKEKDGKKEVCKSFFLSTLGYDIKNDRRVLTAISKPIDQQKDLRGSYDRKNKIDRNIIKAHVLKYNPTISHYRREHAPNRLYLPSDINITMMYNDFCVEHPDMKISCEVYRQIVRQDLNISFAHLGHEECESCAIFTEHNKSHVQTLCESCEVCNNFQAHRSKYTICRKEYQKDVQTAQSSLKTDSETIFYSVDLQKVIMLPRIEQYKRAAFCPRIIAFNESFVPLGRTSDNKPFAAIWPETVSGRSQEDLISTFRAFFVEMRDLKHIVLWMDNCAAQNKNWAMFSFLVQIVNSSKIGAETITFKYLEPGHTFMSADSFHHQVELSLKRKKVYDFEDFGSAVRQANSKKPVVKEMHINDFFDFKDLSSQARLRKREPRCYLRDIMWVQAQRGCLDLKFKTSHVAEEQTLNFLQFKITKSKKFPEVFPKLYPHGIEENRKKQIIELLLPLMPENRRGFWQNLPLKL